MTMVQPIEMPKVRLGRRPDAQPKESSPQPRGKMTAGVQLRKTKQEERQTVEKSKLETPELKHTSPRPTPKFEASKLDTPDLKHLEKEQEAAYVSEI